MAETKRILNKTIEQKVLKFIEQNDLIKQNEKILIALSGGPDSVFAFHFFVKYKLKLGVEIFAAHVNHSLRGKSSDDDASFCKELSQKHNVKYFEKKVDVKKHATEYKLSIEEAARNLRYGFLEETADENQINEIITAHNLNDNAETVLLNLIKGAGLKGISGIPLKRGIISRPLLSISKNEILSYLKENDISFRIDESNEINDYERNFIRNQILPEIKKNINPAVEQNIFNSSLVFQNYTIIEEYIIDGILKKYIKKNEDNDEVKIDIKFFYEYSKEYFGAVLKYILEEILNSTFEFKDYLKLKDLVKREVGKKEQLKNHIYVYKDREYIYITILKNFNFEPVSFKLNTKKKFSGKTISAFLKENNEFSLTENKFHEYINGDQLDENFVLRKWMPGDKFVPLGMKNYKKVADFLAEQKIAHSQKEKQLVLLNGDDIVWIPGFRIDNRFKITEKTKRICELWLK